MLTICQKTLRGTPSISALAAMIALASPSQASVTISTGTTQNMSCSGGVCQPTATTAVLNVNDLEGYLASGNVEVTTTGSGGVQANNIDIEGALTWSDASALLLVANQSVEIDQPVSITGAGGLSFKNGGTLEALAFGSGGNVTFLSLSSSLSINGAAYTLENTVKGLAAAIAKKPKGNFALAASVDAKKDGRYSKSPVPKTFGGIFEGLGNTISKLSMRNIDRRQLGFFAEIGAGGVVRDAGFAKEVVVGRKNGRNRLHQHVGGVVGDNYGTVFRSSSNGKILGGHNSINNDTLGGLVGLNYYGGVVSESFSSAAVETGGVGGGLVGSNASGEVSQSYATGKVVGYWAGGLMGKNANDIGKTGASISQSYATGSATGYYAAGGLVGINYCAVSQSYSTTSVGSVFRDAGGFIGDDESSSGNLSYDYWDLDTSGIPNPRQGAGNVSNDPGIIGLTTAQFQSGLPTGFDPTVWAENSSINNGFPYLINNPPPQ